MLRRGLAALMMGVICAGSVAADDSARGHDNGLRTGGLIGWLRHQSGPSPQKKPTGAPAARGVQQAVVNDAERQAAQLPVHQTSARPQDDVVVVQEVPAEPIIIQQVPPVPNMNELSGPQYFSASASGGFTNPVPVHPGNNWQQYSAPVPIHQASMGQYSPISMPGMAAPVMMGMQGPVSQNVPSGQYPQTGASLYPAPVAGIPHQIGGSMVQNPAFHHHEMLYPHSYKAMYGPYYYKVNGKWMVTPFGVWSHEDWYLQGTTVDVKYKSHISPFSLYRGRTH